jgi:hypothetical protein
VRNPQLDLGAVCLIGFGSSLWIYIDSRSPPLIYHRYSGALLVGVIIFVEMTGQFINGSAPAQLPIIYRFCPLFNLNLFLFERHFFSFD